VTWNSYIRQLKTIFKFGIEKPWRAKNGETYFSISSEGIAEEHVDFGFYLDRTRYDLGNYFLFSDEAKQVLESKEYIEFWEKVKAGEIG